MSLSLSPKILRKLSVIEVGPYVVWAHNSGKFKVELESSGHEVFMGSLEQCLEWIEENMD